ncbi:hypothetical protein FRACYDRAFT_232590 [Fragilariopsis cylindrus CCMP1102]|uniref:Uncharacterized protein n=1 Tax=Fragilariopsis cylindrus CCMP1102 TaxID=635003 RepID=A0A1E7FW94_9STRA|nr:hypothetical protein FRACYDRAFT_232590 [Fragilariopsis cylindrus CCMP1102]|eukprot:OEU22431.1 hypothetical protein FRACYDRAFT_232590 [Fragilariopsis cylindrus CCMP1102]
MEESQGLNQLTEGWASWSYVASPPPSVASVTKDIIPGQTTPETEVNESFHSISSPPIPNSIVFKDDGSPSSLETVPTRLDPNPEVSTMVVNMLTCPAHMNIENNINTNNNNNNNKKRKALLLLDAVVPHPRAPPLIRTGNLMFLRVDLLCYLDEKRNSDFKTLRVTIETNYGDLPCRNCNHMGCKDKINIRHVMAVAKLMAFIRPDSVYDGTWAEVFNHKSFRLQFHQFYCLFLHLNQLTTPPSDCLERDMIALFPSPNDLPDHHHLKQREDAPTTLMQNLISKPMSKHWYLVPAQDVSTTPAEEAKEAAADKAEEAAEAAAVKEEMKN